jgi:glutamine synthetase
MKNGKSQMVKNGDLSDVAKKTIAGFLDLAPSISAFGNLNPMSYFRLVPHQEAPTNICWGDRNRSVLVRVPLGWTGKLDMTLDANPAQKTMDTRRLQRQTVELRSPDGSADIYTLMAALAVAARHGLEMKDALKYADRTYVDVDIFHDQNTKKIKALNHLPASCWESSNALENQKAIYLKYGIFSEGMLDGIIKYHRQFNDKTLREEIKDKPEELLNLVTKYFHCG